MYLSRYRGGSDWIHKALEKMVAHDADQQSRGGAVAASWNSWNSADEHKKPESEKIG